MSHKKHNYHPHHPEEPPSENEVKEEISEAFVKPEAPKRVSISVEEFEGLKNQAEEYKDKYLRVLADMENTRKRMQKERLEYTQYAIGDTIADFLQPLDNFENALGFAGEYSEELKNWALGFQMILTQFKDALANQGVIPIVTKGESFDPHLHEAIEMIETDEAPEGTIMEECMRGYKMGERTLRPARVKVAKSKN